MKRLVVMVVAAGAAVAAVAMPTKAELQKAQEMVTDVTAADVAALKAKTKKPAEVAAKHMELAGQAGSEAEKYLLLQAAFKLYAKAGDYDAAANVIEKLQTEITDYNPEVTVELCGAEFIRKMRENAPRLYALKENARRIVFYRRQLPIREAAVRKTPRDPQAQRKLAECHAELGNWSKALEVFVKAGGEFKKMSEGETSGKIPAQELGDFWWDYETKSDTQIYKLHAAELYRKALADDSFKGLARTRADQRVKESDALASFVVASGRNESAGTRPIDLSKPLVLNLGHGQKFSFLPCPAGSFEMGGRMNGYPNSDGKHKVIITRPFYYLPSFVQSNQWAAVMDRKIEKIDEIFVATRQEHEEYLQKLTERFCGKIPKGYVFRFLTEAEYLYAVNKGKMISSGWSGFFLDLFGADQNGKWQRDVHCWNGSHGLEGAGDQHVKYLTYEDVETDPLVYCRDYLYPKTLVFDFQYRQKKSKSLRFPMFARIAIGPDLVAEKKAIQEKTGIWPISTPAENVSSVNANGGGAAASTKNGACEFKGVLPSTQHVLLWEKVSLKEINQLQARLCGGFIPNECVQSCYMKENDTRKTFQFQAIDDGHLKCVGVELVQRDGDVYGRIAYARHIKYASKNVDFDLNPGKKMDIAKTETDHGYAVKDLSIIDVKAEGNGGADVKKAEATGPVACYPREDFGGVLLSSKYELMEFSGELRHVRYLDGLFNSRKTVEEPSDFAFGVCSNGKKEAGFTLKLSESVTLAGLLVVNRTKVTQERQVPLCVWVSEDRVKWERVFIDESVRDEYRIDLSNKNITCKYLRFGRLPGVNNEPFHLARTLVYVKSSAAEKKAKR